VELRKLADSPLGWVFWNLAGTTVDVRAMLNGELLGEAHVIRVSLDSKAIQPFRIHVADEVLDDLRAGLTRSATRSLNLFRRVRRIRTCLRFPQMGSAAIR
jgi:hypothetical protein